MVLPVPVLVAAREHSDSMDFEVVAGQDSQVLRNMPLAKTEHEEFYQESVPVVALS